MKKKLPSIQQRIDNLSDKYKDLLGVIPDIYPHKEAKLNELSLQYQHHVESNAEFQIKLKHEIKFRELNKEKTFEASKLKIQLPKFKGYDSSLDVYTFQEKFEKLHLKGTPKRHLPELLKNNYLEGSAMDFVKRLKDIDDIWISLKRAFGDPRIMLMKKLTEPESVGQLWRIKDSDKVKNSLNKVVNLMDDLMRLAKDHNIEDKLYNGDAIYSIFKILGDMRVTKFLDQTCDDRLKGKDLWYRLIEFLDKEIKTHLEKSIIYRTLQDKDQNNKDKPENKYQDTKGKYNSHLVDSSAKEDWAPWVEASNSNEPLACSFCEKNGHISTRGPYGKKLVQYFSCKKFADMSPGQRNNELKEKGLCTHTRPKI